MIKQSVTRSSSSHWAAMSRAVIKPPASLTRVLLREGDARRLLMWLDGALKTVSGNRIGLARPGLASTSAKKRLL